MKTKRVQIGNATLYCGDCFEVLPKLDIAVDTVISDPPFGITDCTWDTPIPLDTLWEVLGNRTKQSANFVLFGCGKFTMDLIISKRQWYRYDLIWEKSKKVGFLWANKMPMRSHESIHVFIRPGFFYKATYNPQKIQGGKAGVKTRNHRSNIYRDKGSFTHISDGMLHPGSVLYFKNETGQHPTQKPVPLMEHLVKSYTDTDNLVLDCFMGSGSTGVACAIHNRRFIGIEQNREYFDIAVERIQKAYDECKTV